MAATELSGPLTNINFTDAEWQVIVGSNAGIVGDADGTAYDIAQPPSGNDVEIGSATIASRLVVGGYGHTIPAGTPHSLTIPASTNASIGRTDLIVARFSSAFTPAPGPVRLTRIAGTEGSANPPAHDTTLPGPVDLVLYQITRKQGEGLNQATVVDRRPRAAWTYLVPAGGPLPQSAPLGARATRDGITYRRDMVGSSPDWVEDYRDDVTLTGASATASPVDGWQRSSNSFLERKGRSRWLHQVVSRGPLASTISSDARGGLEVGSQPSAYGLVDLHSADRPPAGVQVAFVGRLLTTANNPFPAYGLLTGSGLSLIGTAPNLTIAPGAEIILDAYWRAG